MSGILLLLAAMLGPSASDQDYFISAPGQQAIYRLDAVTGQLDLFSSPLGIPFYGEWKNGSLYMPDRLLAGVWKIDANGQATIFTAGGFLSSPPTVAPADSGDFYVTEYLNDRIVKLDPTGQQTLLADNSSGLLNGPGGLAIAPDGTLYVGNIENDTIVTVDLSGQVTFFSDGQGLLNRPGGVQIDGAGNVFAANYQDSRIVRIRVRDGKASIFATDPRMDEPNDLKLANDGRLLVTAAESFNLLAIDVLGRVTEIKQDASIGEWFGVAVPADGNRCKGRIRLYGTGTPGSGGMTPLLHGIFSPCPGTTIGIEIEDALGGAAGALLWGTAPASTPGFGGTLLVAFTPPFGFTPVVHPGAGPGGADFVLPVTLPDDPTLSGLSLFLQDLILDPGAPGGVAMSNGIEIEIH